MEGYVLDTSAVAAYLNGEPGEEIVDAILESARSGRGPPVFLPFVVLVETEYTSRRHTPTTIVENWIALMYNWPVEIVESSRDWGRAAAAVKLENRLSFADAWVASLALMRDVELVHKDPEFDSVLGLRAIRLPYSPRTTRGNPN